MKILIFQIIKHIIVGGIATIGDLVFFIALSFILPGVYNFSSVIIKACSFIFAALIKYFGNKFWTFSDFKEGISHRQFLKFLAVNLIGLFIDVFIFYILIKIVGPQMRISLDIWEKLSVLAAATIAGVWNFCGDKFFVFKK